MSKSMSELFAEFDAIQKDRAANEELLEELDNSSGSKAAEQRQDMIDGWDQSESELLHELMAVLRPESFGNTGPAVAQAGELRRMGYDAFATADGRITVNMTVAQAIFVQGVTAVANTREARKADKLGDDGPDHLQGYETIEAQIFSRIWHGDRDILNGVLMFARRWMDQHHPDGWKLNAGLDTKGNSDGLGEAVVAFCKLMDGGFEELKFYNWDLIDPVEVENEVVEELAGEDQDVNVVED